MDEVNRIKAARQARSHPSSRAGQRVGSAALYEPIASVSWFAQPPTAATFRGVDNWRLAGNTALLDGDFVQWGKAQLIMQSDGNLVIYDENGKSRWASGSNGHPGAIAYFQTDGNFVVYDYDGTPLKWSGTCCHSGWNLHVQEDGNMVIYAPTWVHKWSTRTAH
jgi:hypothetical protein